MSRKSVARLLLVASVMLALSLQRTWVTVTEDVAGALIRQERTGALTLPVLDALLIANLVTVLGIFLLPGLAQRLLLGLTAILALFSFLLTGQWLLSHEFGFGPVLALLATLLASYGAIRGMWSVQTPLGPRADRKDPWRALDNGVDPTVDQ